MRLLLLVLGVLSYSFLFGQPLNDDFVNAIDVSSLIGSCSSDAAFDNSDATNDGSDGFCFGMSNQLAGNMWFKFVATSSMEMTVTIDVGGVKGSMQRARLAVWESDGSTELGCDSDESSGDVSVEVTGLTDGATYYFSVDNRTGSKAGTFTVCLDAGSGSSATNDEFSDAYDVTSIIGSCSSDAQYDNTGATADGSTPSCHSNNFNLWFKFIAPSSGNIEITVDRGGTKGTIQRVYISLWESNGTTELACTSYGHQDDDVSLVYGGLTPGNTYYFAVDNNNSTKSGSFSLCMNALDIFYSIADGNWNSSSTWSHDGHLGSSTSLTPGSSNIVQIKGHDVTVASEGVCDSLLIDASSDQTSLTLNANLTIGSNAWFQNLGENIDAFIAVQNGATLNAANLYIQRNGGDNLFQISLGTSSRITLNSLNFNSSSGNTYHTALLIDGDGALSVTGELNIVSTGGQLIKLQADKTSSITVGDVNFDCSSSLLGEIEMNSSSSLYVSGSITRTSSYGTLDMNGSSIIEFNGTSSQSIPTIYGSGGDAFNYVNIRVNNSSFSSPQLYLEGVVMLSGSLILQDGIIESTDANRIFVLNGGNTSGGSTDSYVEGPITKIGSDSFEFPVGKDGFYAPLTISAPSSASDYFTAQYLRDNPGSLYDNSAKDENIDELSSQEYWLLDRIGTSSVSVTLSVDKSRADSLSPINDMIVCHWNGSSWEDIGNSSYAGDNRNGSITSNSISDFSPLALAKSVSGGNILPIEMISFNVINEDNIHVKLNWVTATELNNDYFEIFRANLHTDWESIGTIDGNGTTTNISSYDFIDYLPLNGLSYYKLKQVDFDGTTDYSEVQAVKFSGADMIKVEVYPNPTSKDLTIKGVDPNIIVRVVNISGQDLSHLIHEIGTGEDFIQLNVQSLPAGNYIAIIGPDILRFFKQ